RRPPSKRVAESSSNRIHQIWIDMRQGVSFIFHHAAVLFVVLAMAAGLFTIGCFGPLIAIYVRDTLRASPRLFGYISGMVAVGMPTGTQVVRRFVQQLSNETWVLTGLAGIGLGALILGSVPYAAAAMTSTFTIGLAFAAIMVPAQTLLQRETPHEMI